MTTFRCSNNSILPTTDYFHNLINIISNNKKYNLTSC